MSDSAPDGIDEEATGTFRELRQYARGDLDVDHHDVLPFAGLVGDADTREVLRFMFENHAPTRDEIDAGIPRDFMDTAFANRAVRKHATERATTAIREGNVTQAAYFSGLPSYKSDVSGLHAINQLAEWLVHSENCKLIYMAALMGRGKTDLSLTFLEIINDHYRRVRRHVGDEVELPVPEFAANFHAEAAGDAEIREIRTEGDLLEWASGGSSDMVRWFVFDEASTELTAQSGKNAQKVAEKFAPFVKKMRKMGINMIVIGHDSGDVHVAIRSLADFVDKTGLKTASFYAGIKKREPTGHLFDVAGIPPTSWSFDTDDTAEWSWIGEGEAEPEDQGMTEDEFKQAIAERAARIYLSTELTQREVASAISTEDVSVSPATVSRYAQNLADGEAAAETEATA